MSRAVRHISISYLAYVLLLLGFASLGLFVAALATGGELAVIIGVGLFACFAGAVAAFRAAARKVAQSREAGDAGDNVSIFAAPLRREQLDRYLENYRGGRGSVPQAARVMTVVASGDSMELEVSRASGPKHARAGSASQGRSSARPPSVSTSICSGKWQLGPVEGAAARV